MGIHSISQKYMNDEIKLTRVDPPGGYSLDSDDRDNRRIFRGCNRRFGIFSKQNPLKR